MRRSTHARAENLRALSRANLHLWPLSLHLDAHRASAYQDGPQEGSAGREVTSAGTPIFCQSKKVVLKVGSEFKTKIPTTCDTAFPQWLHTRLGQIDSWSMLWSPGAMCGHRRKSPQACGAVSVAHRAWICDTRYGCGRPGGVTTESSSAARS